MTPQYHTQACLSMEMLISYMSESLADEKRRMVEEHLLDCPLCSGALEGLSKINNHGNLEKNIHHLNQNIKQKTGALHPSLFGDWKIKMVGIILLLALAGRGFYFFTGNPSAEESLNNNAERALSPGQNEPASPAVAQNDMAVASPRVSAEMNNTVVRDKTTTKESSDKKDASSSSKNKQREIPPSYLPDKGSEDKNRNAAENPEEYGIHAQPSAEVKEKSAEAEKDKAEAPRTVPADANPEYPGGESRMFEFIRANLKYPVAAKKSGLQGQVYVSFVINKDGSIGEIKIIKGLSKELDEEAARVVKAIPAWKPARKKGENVPSTYNLVVSFGL